MALRIFISHARQDVAFAERLAEDLRSAGADVWLDATHIGTGNFVQRINEAINARDILVLVLTPDALTSQWVPDEMDAALVRYKQGFMKAPVVVLAKSLPLRDIPALWTTYNRIDASENYDDAFPLIIRALEMTLPKARPPMSAQVPDLAVNPTPAPRITPPSAPVSSPSVVPPQRVPDSAGRATPTASKALPFGSSQTPPSILSPIAATAQPATSPAAHSMRAMPRVSRRNMLIGGGVLVVAATSTGVGWIIEHANPGPPYRVVAGTQRWSYKTGNAVYSAPVVANGLVYVGSDDNFVYALDASTGTKRWSYKTGDTVEADPTVANRLVYVGSNDHDVYALDASSGIKRWSFDTGYAFPTAAVVANGLVYVSSILGGALYALDATTGDKRWSFQADSTLAAPAVSNGIAYAGSNDHSIYAIDAITGTKKWSYQTGDRVEFKPAVAGGLVYVGSRDHNLYAIDAVSGKKRWSYSMGDWAWSSPALVNGLVCIGSNDHNVYALDATTGIKRWSFDTGARQPNVAAAGNNSVYISSGNDFVYALDAATGDKRWSYQPGIGGILTSPTVANGLVYVSSTDGSVYALNA